MIWLVELAWLCIEGEEISSLLTGYIRLKMSERWALCTDERVSDCDNENGSNITVLRYIEELKLKWLWKTK